MPLPPLLSGIDVGTVSIGELAALPLGAGAGDGKGHAGGDAVMSPGIGAGMELMPLEGAVLVAVVMERLLWRLFVNRDCRILESRG
ncbi:hypothetical protein NC653_014396 [Populus alba x Populus x berolinensis]|uniref:Uncharacterized protein n=1 Tax=Populus alba x Populus x berolinensis TaxID=444605 RepID=A0AAD6QX16_9ROSI|nr:hypothetical protein NC653_014396 [Populus alba x Populus x berolinensis]